MSKSVENSYNEFVCTNLTTYAGEQDLKCPQQTLCMIFLDKLLLKFGKLFLVETLPQITDLL